MGREAMLERIAPCGVICHTCAASKHGVIRRMSRALQEHLDGFGAFAERMSALDPRLKKYPDFEQGLQMLAEAGCGGCRDGVARYPGCEIAACIRERGHDFCYRCDEFPSCAKADFEPMLKHKWLQANRRMKDVGPEAFFEEMIGRSHYRM
jgi:Protein of unknown function (DUF3795)